MKHIREMILVFPSLHFYQFAQTKNYTFLQLYLRKTASLIQSKANIRPLPAQLSPFDVMFMMGGNGAVCVIVSNITKLNVD